MRWIIFTGTWRLTNSEVENDVRQAAREVYKNGDGIVTGGATGVDYFVMDEFLKHDPGATRMRVFIPARLKHFLEDYRKNWKHAPITDTHIDNLERVLRLIQSRNPSALFEEKKETGDITQDEYNLRNTMEILWSDEVYAFQVNGSIGTADTIKKAREAGLPISIHKTYTISE